MLVRNELQRESYNSFWGFLQFQQDLSFDIIDNVLTIPLSHSNNLSNNVGIIVGCGTRIDEISYKASFH